jgi:acyl carrier protein
MTQQLIGTRAALEEIVRRFAPRDRSAIPVTAATRLIEDLGIDSPRMIDVVLEVEDRFGITVDDEAIERIRTFGEMHALVAQLAGLED